MALKWYSIVVDCVDVQEQARWWAGVLDWQLIYDTPEEAVIIPKDATDEKLTADQWTRVGPGLVFVPVPEGKLVKNRLHIDLAPHISDDRDAMIAELIARGASLVDIGQGEVSWTVLTDPEGNEFCVLSARDQ